MATQKILEYLSKPRVGKMAIPLKSGSKLLLDCVAQLTPDFLLTEFLPDQLPNSTIDIDQECLVSFETGTTFFTLTAKIQEIVEGCKIVLTDAKPAAVKPSQKRDFFRVNIKLPINVDPRPTVIEKTEPFWPMAGEATNLSGSGLQITFNKPYEKVTLHQHVLLNIPLPVPRLQTVTCSATVMREQIQPDGTYVVCVRFDNLEEKELDKIVAYCLAKQRQELSLKVQILGSEP